MFFHIQVHEMRYCLYIDTVYIFVYFKVFTKGRGLGYSDNDEDMYKSNYSDYYKDNCK